MALPNAWEGVQHKTWRGAYCLNLVIQGGTSKIELGILVGIDVQEVVQEEGACSAGSMSHARTPP